MSIKFFHLCNYWVIIVDHIIFSPVRVFKICFSIPTIFYNPHFTNCCTCSCTNAIFPIINHLVLLCHKDLEKYLIFIYYCFSIQKLKSKDFFVNEMSESNPLEKRKEKIFNFIRNYKDDFGFLGLILLIFIGFKIRISNLVHLKDITTGKFIPGDPDAAAFLRYAKYILEHGKLMDIDMMRYYPLGYSNLDEFNFLSHFIVYLYKFLHFFNNNITLEYVDVIFPAITFGAALIFFYLLIRKLFDFRVALLASAFLTFMPPFLYRITSGFFTALLGSVWGGVNFVFLIIGGTVIVKIITDNLEKNYFYSYALWWFTSFILLNRFYNYYYGFQSILVATTAQITALALISGFIYYTE